MTYNSEYIVLAVSLMIWIGIAFYLFRIDSKLKKLEKQLQED